MAEHALQVPEPIEVVSVPGLASRFDVEAAALAAAATRVVALRSTASELERRMAAERVDADTAAWMMVRLQQFLVQWHEEVEAEAAALVAGARQRAAQIRRGDRELAVSLATIRWTPPPAAVVTPAPLVPVTPEVVPAAVLVTPEVVPTAVLAAPIVGVVAGPAIVDPLLDPLRDPLLDPLLDLSPAADAADDADEVSADDTHERAFWPGDGRRRGRRRRRVSTAVLLQMLAGVAAVAAVAVHLA